MAVINIRVNDEVKRSFKSLGLNISVTINLFLKMYK